MTVTIEPGIYLIPAVWENDEFTRPFADVVNRSAVDALLQEGFGGIRLEEDICVRSDDGPEVLTAALPIDADEVAAIVSS
jgi:Xaa-Pro aminopeptidase